VKVGDLVKCRRFDEIGIILEIKYNVSSATAWMVVQTNKEKRLEKREWLEVINEHR